MAYGKNWHWLWAFRNAFKFKAGTVNFANSLSLPSSHSIVKKVITRNKTAKGVNDPAWTTQWAQWEGWSHSRASSTSQMGLWECCYNYLSNTAGASFLGLVKTGMNPPPPPPHIGYSAIYIYIYNYNVILIEIIICIIVYHHELECFVKRMAAVIKGSVLQILRQMPNLFLNLD